MGGVSIKKINNINYGLHCYHTVSVQSSTQLWGYFRIDSKIKFNNGLPPKFAQVQYKSPHIHKCGHFKLGPHTLSTISALIPSEILTVLLF